MRNTLGGEEAHGDEEKQDEEEEHGDEEYVESMKTKGRGKGRTTTFTKRKRWEIPQGNRRCLLISAMLLSYYEPIIAK